MWLKYGEKTTKRGQIAKISVLVIEKFNVVQTVIKLQI